MNDVPQVRGGLPLIGHAIPFRRNPVAMLERERERHGDMFRFRLLGQTVYALLSPKGNEAFFRATDMQLSPREAYQFTVPIFGKGVAYDVSPELMDEQLEFVFPALRDEAMQRYAGIMADEVEQLTERMGEEGELDLLATMNELTIFIAGRCLLGEAFRRAISSEFAALYHALESGINLIAFMAPNFPSLANLRRNRARRRVVALISELIRARRNARAREDDFLAALMAARYSDGSTLSDETIAGLVLTLLFAGQHTSAVMATWLGVLLLQHPRDLANVRSEISSVIGTDAMHLAALKRLRRLEWCLKEAERLYPPLILLMRKALCDIEVDGRVLPRGGLALVSPACSHRLPHVFCDPDRFDPDRFAPPREEDRATPYSLIGFGGGKHRCIGLAFAHQQIKVIWSRLLQSYDFELVDADVKPNYSTWVVGPQPPCRIRYRRRHQAVAAGVSVPASAF